MTDQDKNIIGELKRSPLFNLSLSSKELFHSNFLAWIGNNYKDIFEKLLKKLCGVELSGDWKVKREYHNFDLCIEKENKIVFVLENKVKSIPDLAQLKKYGKEVPDDAEKVLLSLATDFPDRDGIEKSGWKIIYYSDLKRELRKVINEFPNDYLKELVNDYCDFIGNLHQLTEGWLIKDDSSFLLSPLSEPFSELRISDLREKLWHSQLIAGLQRELSVMLQNKFSSIASFEVVSGFNIQHIKEEKNASLKKVFINWGFTHGQGLIEAKVKINNWYVLLIQVQGNRYCHGIEWMKGGSHEKLWEETKHEALVRELSFFQFDEETAHFPQIFKDVKMVPKYRKTEGKSRIYNKYGDPFLYQSVKIVNETVNDIISAVTEDIENILRTALSLEGI